MRPTDEQRSHHVAANGLSSGTQPAAHAVRWGFHCSLGWAALRLYTVTPRQTKSADRSSTWTFCIGTVAAWRLSGQYFLSRKHSAPTETGTAERAVGHVARPNTRFVETEAGDATARCPHMAVVMCTSSVTTFSKPLWRAANASRTPHK